MSEDLNKQMDESLREYSRQRKEEASVPFELHPVNRNQLQAEVTRLHRRLPFSPGKSSRVFHWGWIAATASVALLAGSVYWMNYRDRLADQRQMAMSRSEEKPNPQADRPSTLAKKEIAADSVARSGSRSVALAPAQEKNQVEGGPALAATPSAPSTQGVARSARKIPKDLFSTDVQLQSLPTSVAANQEAEAFTYTIADVFAAVPSDQIFSSSPASRNDLKDSSTGPVLQLFQFKQSGTNLQVVDGDGSVYQGAAFLNEKDSQSPSKAIGFKLEGKSRTLNQPVRFEGNIYVPEGTLGQKATKQKNVGTKVVGTAQVGKTNQIAIEAQPASE